MSAAVDGCSGAGGSDSGGGGKCNNLIKTAFSSPFLCARNRKIRLGNFFP